MTRLPISLETNADDLRTMPFGHVLLDLFETRRTGTLLVYAVDDALRAAIRVEAGRPTGVLAAENGERKVTDVLMPLCAEIEGRFEFLEGQDLVGSDGLMAAGPIDPLPMVMAAARDALREDVVVQVMRLISRSLIKLSPGLDARRYGFTVEERLVLRGLEQGPIELDELRAKTQASDDVIRRVLYVLRITRGIGLLPLNRSASGTVFTAPALTAPSNRPSVPARPPSPSSGVQSLRPSAVQALRASLPPRAFPSPASTPVTAPQSGAASQEDRSPKERAEALWQQAKALSRRGQHEAALRTAHSAVKLGAPSPAREALLGWLIYQHAGGGETANPAVWKCLNHALKRDALCEDALYYKGLVLGRIGQADHAYAHFQRVLMLDPKHSGAEREIRLHEMRRDQERQQSGFLRRLLSSRPAPKSGQGSQ
jgi:tetratricopeptide (TPR) repeat protein